MIFHILTKSEWQDAVRRGKYEPGSLAAEGFVHASTREQTIPTAERFFRGQQDLVLLCIERRHLKAEVRFEAPADTADDRRHELFPHVYGPINLDAVAHVFDLPCDADGGFQLPGGM